MTDTIKRIFYILTLTAVFSSGKAVAQSGTKVDFGSGWEFRREEAGSEWEHVTIPHTMKTEPLVVNNQFQGIGWYRKTFAVGSQEDKKIFLYFEGIMQEADVWINGQKAANHKGGYLPFTVDATDFVKYGQENTISIQVTNIDNPEFPPGKPLRDLDFNYYGGIYRNVYLITTDRLYITNAVHAGKKADGGIFVRFKKADPDLAEGTVSVDLKNEHDKEMAAALQFTLTDQAGKKTTFTSGDIILKSGEQKSGQYNFAIRKPKLWSVEDPQLYDMAIAIVSGHKTVGNYSEKIGIRNSELRRDGYYLNGKKLFISGTNRHQEYPYLGYAISDGAQYRDAVKIKNAGFDFVRLSHYPQAEAFLDACDELGILVMTSIPGWQFFGNEKFRGEALQNVRDMARRDRNHPCIIFWEVSLNESGMDGAFMEKANAVLREELPYGNNITAGWIDNPAYDLFIPARQHAKAPDYWHKYSNGDRRILIAEYGDWEYYAQNAGFSQKEFANLKEEERTSRQLRAFGEKRLLQQAFNFQEADNSNRKGAATIGEANWLMFDYNRGYSDDLESSGISDIFRIPKFAYYFYQSQRAPVKYNAKLATGPMVHIASYWTPLSPADLTVYSNCDEVALYLNNKLIGRQKPDINPNSDALPHPPFIFKTGGFIPGILRAEGYLKGKKVCEHTVSTPGKAAKIELLCDLSTKAIDPGFPDTVFVYAQITDENGTVVPDSSDEITFSLEGDDAVLTGANPVKAEAGTATIILRTESFHHPLKIKASAANLPTATLELKK